MKVLVLILLQLVSVVGGVSLICLPRLPLAAALDSIQTISIAVALFGAPVFLVNILLTSLVFDFKRSQNSGATRNEGAANESK